MPQAEWDWDICPGPLWLARPLKDGNDDPVMLLGSQVNDPVMHFVADVSNITSVDNKMVSA